MALHHSTLQETSAAARVLPAPHKPQVKFNMRQLVIDTETTGLNAQRGDRLIEFGCVELYHRRLTGHTLHFYINPERDSDPAAFAIHGLSTEFLSDKPKFAEVAASLCDFVQGAEVIIHNAPFDVGFLDAELSRLKRPLFSHYCCSVIDTLVHAKMLFPGKRHSLDAMCDRFGICRTHRSRHGALLDAELLAHVYLAMTRGQDPLITSESDLSKTAQKLQVSTLNIKGVEALMLRKANAEEQAAHQQALKSLTEESAGHCVWEAITL